MTWTWTRARCTTPEHERKRAPCHILWCWVTCISWLNFRVLSCHPCACASLFWVHLSHSLLRSALHHLLPSHALWAAHRSRQPDRHAKHTHFREQGEHRRLRRLRLRHRIVKYELKSFHKTIWANLYWGKILVFFLTIYRLGGLSWIHFAKRWRFIWKPKCWIWGNTKIVDPYWKLQLVVYKVNTELRSESSLWTGTILTHGSELVMTLTSWSRSWTIFCRKVQKGSLKNMR